MIFILTLSLKIRSVRRELPEHLVSGSSTINILREATVPFVVKLISPSGKMSFISAPDFEGCDIERRISQFSL